MQVTIGKVVGFLLVTAYAFIALHYFGMAGLKWSAGLLVPLAAIRFPEELGNLTGYFRTGYVNTQTPAPIISLLGWLFLLGLPVAAYLLK